MVCGTTKYWNNIALYVTPGTTRDSRIDKEGDQLGWTSERVGGHSTKIPSRLHIFLSHQSGGTKN